MEMSNEARNREILVMHHSGVSLRTIAARYALSYQRIQQILDRQAPRQCPNKCGHTLGWEPIYGRCCSRCGDSSPRPHTFYCDKRNGITREYFVWFDAQDASVLHRIDAVSPEAAASELRTAYPDRPSPVRVIDANTPVLKEFS